MKDTAEQSKHYNQKVRRKAEFIKPPNLLKAKVGSGGLGDDILIKAQELLENNAVDFLPLAEIYLAALLNALEHARKNQGEDAEHLITKMIYPAMQLKANGGMFHYPLITSIADRLVRFLEVLEVPDVDALEIVDAYHTTMRAVILGKVTGTGGRHGDELIAALDSAGTRYFQRYPGNTRKAEYEDLNKEIRD